MLQHPTCFPDRRKQLHLSDVSGREETRDLQPGLCPWFMLSQMGQTLTSTRREVASVLFLLIILWAAKTMLLKLLLFSARENASSCARLVPRSDCILTLIYHPFVVLSLVFAFSANLQLMSDKPRFFLLLLL